MRIIVFWDSISEGFWDYEKGWWVNRLKIDFWKKYGYDKMFFNAWISAYTSENIINCFSHIFSAISRREPWKEKSTTIIFAISINDSAESMTSWVTRVDKYAFQQNVRTLIKMCKDEQLIERVIFLSATNVEEEVINQESNLWAEHYFYNSKIQKYNSTIKQLAAENNYDYIDIFGDMEQGDLEDWLHPSSKWHEKIYQKVLEFIEQ